MDRRLVTVGLAYVAALQANGTKPQGEEADGCQTVDGAPRWVRHGASTGGTKVALFQDLILFLNLSLSPSPSLSLSLPLPLSPASGAKPRPSRFLLCGLGVIQSPWRSLVGSHHGLVGARRCCLACTRVLPRCNRCNAHNWLQACCEHGNMHFSCVRLQARCN